MKVSRTLLFLTLLFLPTQLGKHFWPNFSYLYSLKVDYFSPTFFLWDLIFLTLLIIWATTKPRINVRALSVLLFFLLTQVLSLIPAANIGPGLVRLEQLTLTGFFGLYLASQKFSKFSTLLNKALVISLVFEGVLATGQFLFEGSLGFWFLGERSFTLSTPAIAKFNWFGQVFLRSYATFPHPNVMAGFMVLVIPIVAYLNKSHLKKIIISVGVLGALLSFSRAAALILLAECFYLLRKKIIILILVLVIIAPLFVVRFNSAFDFDNISLARREVLMQSATHIFLKHPIFGVGLNNFIAQISTDLIVGSSRFLQPVHNIFLLTLVETGLFGFLGFILLLSFPIIMLLKHIVNPFAKILLFGWATIIFLGMFDHYFLTLPQGQRMLFLFWGLSLSIRD